MSKMFGHGMDVSDHQLDHIVHVTHYNRLIIDDITSTNLYRLNRIQLQ